MNKNKPLKDLNYYLTLFKLKGHETWRAHLSQKKMGFDNERNSNTVGKWPEITAKQVIMIDRITGQFKL